MSDSFQCSHYCFHHRIRSTQHHYVIIRGRSNQFEHLGRIRSQIEQTMIGKGRPPHSPAHTRTPSIARLWYRIRETEAIRVRLSQHVQFLPESTIVSVRSLIDDWSPLTWEIHPSPYYWRIWDGDCYSPSSLPTTISESAMDTVKPGISRPANGYPLFTCSSGVIPVPPAMAVIWENDRLSLFFDRPIRNAPRPL